MRVDKISFSGTGHMIKEDDTKGFKKPLANLMDSSSDSFESASKGIKHNSGLKRLFNKAMMGLGVIGLGLGAQACDPTDIPVDPPVVPPVKTELSETQKGFMAVMSDVTGAKFKEGQMLDSAYVKEADYYGNIVGYNGYKIDKKASTKDTIVYNQYIYNNKSELIDKYNVKAYKNSKGNIETKSYDDLKYFLGVEEFTKDGKSTIQSFDNVKRFRFTPNDSIVDKTALSNGVKKYLKNLYNSVK